MFNHFHFYLKNSHQVAIVVTLCTHLCWEPINVPTMCMSIM